MMTEPIIVLLALMPENRIVQGGLNSAKAAAAELDDDSTSPQRKGQILDEMKQRGYTEEMVFADRVSNNMDTQESVRNARDSHHDEELSHARPSDAPMKFLS